MTADMTLHKGCQAPLAPPAEAALEAVITNRDTRKPPSSTWGQQSTLTSSKALVRSTRTLKGAALSIILSTCCMSIQHIQSMEESAAPLTLVSVPMPMSTIQNISCTRRHGKDFFMSASNSLKHTGRSDDTKLDGSFAVNQCKHSSLGFTRKLPKHDYICSCGGPQQIKWLLQHNKHHATWAVRAKCETKTRHS